MSKEPGKMVTMIYYKFIIFTNIYIIHTFIYMYVYICICNEFVIFLMY
jgi:hypothetical protein